MVRDGSGAAVNVLVSAIDPLTPADIREVMRWRYPPPYHVYDIKRSRSVRKELLEGSYFAARSADGTLVGFFCYGRSAQIAHGRTVGAYDEERLDIGLALKPELTGHGYGADFLKAGLAYGVRRYSAGKFRLSVRAFNVRAIKVYEEVGFVRTGSFTIPDAGRVFLVMVLDI